MNTFKILTRPVTAKQFTHYGTSDWSAMPAKFHPLRNVSLTRNTVTLTDGTEARFYVDHQTDLNVPSATTVVGAVDLDAKHAIQAWRDSLGHEEADRITERSARIGTAAHMLCEYYVAGIAKPFLALIDEETKIAEACFKLLAYELAANVDVVVACEQAVISREHKVAGTLDMLAYHKGKLSIVDYKTYGRVRAPEMLAHAFVQLAIYAQSVMEMTGVEVEKLVIIQGHPDVGLKVYEEPVSSFLPTALEYVQAFHVFFNPTSYT